MADLDRALKKAATIADLTKKITDAQKVRDQALQTANAAGQAVKAAPTPENQAAKVKVDPSHRFSGMDAYQKLIDSGVDRLIVLPM